jgi:hypothetical protein
MLSREAWYTLVIGVFLGALVSIPLQLATGLMFPSFQRWFEGKMKARAFKKSKRMRKEYEEALYFVTYPHKMTHYFLNRGVGFLQLLIFLVLGVLSLGHIPPTAWAPAWMGITTILLLFWMLFTIIQGINRLHAIYYRVEFWSEYKKEVERELPNIKP